MKIARRAYGCLIAVIALLAIIILLFLPIWKGHDVVVMTAKSANGESASIVAYLTSLLMGEYDADLVIRSTEGRIIERTNLLLNRDAIEDVRAEFLSLEFRGDNVHLEATGDHYHGPKDFRY